MLTDIQLEKYADVLLWGMRTARTERFRKGDIVRIIYELDALPLATILHRKILKAGYYPVQKLMGTHVMEKDLFTYGNDKQITFITPGQDELTRNLNGSIYLIAPRSLTHLKDVDPKKIGKAAVAKKKLREILNKREEEGAFGWTLCLFPTSTLAEHARMPLEEYTNQIVTACFLDMEDPVAQWKKIHKNAVRIKKKLNDLDIKQLHIESKNTDLVVTPGEKRQWVGMSGHNIPSFELFLSPDWRGTEGVYFADQPSFRSGNYVEGVRLEFKNGKAVKIEAETGQDFVKNHLSTDPGACRLGEFSLTDIRFSKIDKFMANTLFDENFGGAHGNCHVALGSSYSESYAGDPGELTKELKKVLGFNDSAIHWDLVNTEEKRVTAVLHSEESLILYEDGKFTI